MKKLTILLVFMALGLFEMRAVEPMFKMDDKVVNLTLGFGNLYAAGLYYRSSLPVMSVSFEKAYMENFIVDDLTLGIGGILSYNSYKWEYRYSSGESYGYRYNSIIAAARAAVHYPLVDKLDTYTGFILGANIRTAHPFGTNTGFYSYRAAGSGVAYAWFIGGRYYIKDNIALVGELGYGIAYLNLGLALKLK